MTHVEELSRGERFAFGSNWASFLSLLDDDRVREADKFAKEWAWGRNPQRQDLSRCGLW